jgi:hypothetical protein
VHSFDRAAYGALTTRLTPNSGYFDARSAVEQVIIDSRLDPVVLRVAREVFDQNKICSGCPTAPDAAGDVVSSAPQTQQHPRVSGGRVAWLDFSAGNEIQGYAASAGVDGSKRARSSSSSVLDVAFAGQALLTLDVNGNLIRTAGSDSRRVEQVPSVDATFIAGLGGSDTGAAWLSRGATVSYMDARGAVAQANVAGLGSRDAITAVAAGGGTVAIGTQKGKVFTWKPGSGGFRQVGQVDHQVYDLATYAGNVLVLDGPQFSDVLQSTLIRADGRQVAVTRNAMPFGAAMSSDYVVWSEAVGTIDSELTAKRGVPFLETDLYLLSLSTGTIYNLHNTAGQQGFPAISGHRLVWQDAVFGGDDVMTMQLPDKL